MHRTTIQTKNDPVQNVNSAKVEKPLYMEILEVN